MVSEYPLSSAENIVEIAMKDSSKITILMAKEFSTGLMAEGMKETG